MQPYQQSFLDLCLELEVLQFGSFTLKSGRESPYFFNAGRFDSGQRLRHLGNAYAAAIRNADLQFDMLFGPAYKGIPLVAATAVALASQYQEDVPFAFNRKEAKDHGEGGQLIGAPLDGRIVVIDDVISAGTSIQQSAQIITAAGAQMVAVAIALDRQERGQGQISASQEVTQRFGVPVISIIGLDTLIDYLQSNSHHASLRDKVIEYRGKYGVNA